VLSAIALALKTLLLSKSHLSRSRAFPDVRPAVELVVRDVSIARRGNYHNALCALFENPKCGLNRGLELVVDRLRERTLRFVQVSRLDANDVTVWLKAERHRSLS
jgi:hypothetical protein